ncbi:MAG: hypothetical protein QUU85_06665, partial [Candidatus Eisenbacteria bacterium]|nr:hypothetical protein [Candidatus Eisenbacteria bacterium]
QRCLVGSEMCIRDSVEALSAQPPAIGVRGAGDHETSTVIFQVQDRHGIPVDEDHAVVLDFHLEQPQNTDATLYPESAATDARGLAWTTVNAGFRSGTVGIAATSGSLYGEPIFVAIHGGKPDERHFSISFERLNIAGLVYDGIRNAITARVGDRWGNPVPDSTRVWFRAEYGLIQGSEGSTEFGEATVQEITAGPHPQIPGGDGLVLLTAQTVDSTAQWIETAGHVMWSGPTIVEILEPSNGFDIPNGGSINITYRVRDANFNPLVGGTSITMSATAGELGGDVGFTLPDTQSRSYTMFGGTLSDDDPETNEPESVTITVTVTSQNGNRAARVTGIKH